MPKYKPETKVKKTLEKHLDSLKEMFKELKSIEFNNKEEQEKKFNILKKYYIIIQHTRDLLSKVNKAIQMGTANRFLRI